MNDPAAIAVDIQEQRDWLDTHRQQLNLSWTELAKRTNIPSSTISLYGSGKYAGDNQKIADAIYRYRQTLAAQSVIDVEAPTVPGFFQTPTATQLMDLLHWAQRGKMVYAAVDSGNGKTQAVEQFRKCFANVFIATVSSSSESLIPMLEEILEVLGEPNATGGARKLSRQVRDRLINLRNPLLIIDEAQGLTVKAIEELRSLNDKYKIGIALCGDRRLAKIIDAGTGKGELPQLRSRMMRFIQAHPQPGDIEALCQAWNIQNPKLQKEIERICLLPQGGALRTATQVMELATMIAQAKGETIDLADLRAAHSQVAGRMIAQ